MKRIVLLLLLFTSLGFSQVGVNTTTPNPSSMLDVSATNKGVLFPRVSLSNVTLTTLDGTNTAATGLLIWNTNATTTGGNGVGYYYFNGTIWVPVVQTGANDHDWYEVGTTLAPNAITDNMFHTGNVVIGKNTIGFDNPKLSIEESGSGTPLVPSNILYIKDISTSTTSHTGINLQMEATTTASEYGITVSHNNPNAILKYGVESSVQNGSGTNSAFQGRIRGSGLNEGIGIIISDSGSPSSSQQTGHYNDLNQPTTGWTYGMRNSFNTNNIAIDSGRKFGLHNLFGANVGGDLYGTYNDFSIVSASSNNRYGTFTTISPASGGTHYGIYSDVTKSNSYAGYFLGRMSIGTTTFNNYILPSSRGAANQIMQTDGVGNVSWVNPVIDTDDQTTDVFSLTGSTLNLSLQNDGVATQTVDLSPLKDHDFYEVGGTTAPDAITDNKYTQGTLTIGTNTAATGVLDVDNATKATSIDINNTFATNPTGINLNITSNSTDKTGLKTEFNGTAATGTNSFIQNTDNIVGNTNRTAISNDFNGTSTSISTSITGMKNDFKSTSNYYGALFGVTNLFSGNNNAWNYGITNSFTNSGSNPSYGVVNSFNGTSTGQVNGIINSSNNYNGTIFGVENNFSGTGNGTHFGVYNSLNGTGIGDKYGDYTFIANTAGGTHYGIYSNVLKSGSYAGYFLGNVSIGTTALNNYILPASRGTNGQIMQTDGSGNVSWVNSPTDTDDQATDIFSLTGNTLNLSLQNDGVATQTVDLSPIDNQNIDVLSLTGDTLNISLIDDGVATQTLNLSSIDNQATDVFSLTGNTLNLSLQNDGVATQTVDLSTIDNQNIDVLSLTGDTLNISLIDDGVATQTLNLSSIDNQATDVFSLTGNTLNLSLQNDGIATQTVDLSTIDNQNIDVLSLTGDNLNISLIDDGVATQTLNLSSIDNQATDVFSLTGDILNLSLQNDGVATQTVDLSSIDNQATDVFSLTGSTLNLSLQNDGVSTQTVDLSSLKDADWFEVGSANPPNAITDDMFTLGDVSVGKITTAVGKFDVFNTTKLNTIALNNNTASAGVKVGIDNSITTTASQNGSSAIFNTISGTAPDKSGIINYFSNSIPSVTPTSEYGINNGFTSSGNMVITGYNNSFAPITLNTGAIVGYNNLLFNNNQTGSFHGLNNLITNNSPSEQFGVLNSFTGGGNGDRKGTLNMFSGNSNGEVHGTETLISTTGTGFKYGEKITIDNTAGGTHFGIFADVTKANSYAGYFLGRVAVGNTLANTYIFPPSRGTNGQIMQTDGVGNVSWVNAPNSDADWYEVGGTNPANAITDNIYTSGDVSIGKTTAANAKMDIDSNTKLSTLYLVNSNTTAGSKSGIYNVVQMTASNPISFGITNVISGLSALKQGISNDFSSANVASPITEMGISNNFKSTGNTSFIGTINAFSPVTTNTGSHIGTYNEVLLDNIGSFTGFQNSVSNITNSNQFGLLNSFIGSGSGNRYGVKNEVSGTGTGDIYGIHTEITTTGAGNKFGESITIDNAIGGVHYGIASNVTKSNSYAGYFLGRVAVGTTIANNYILPLSRGTNGQIIQTDGVGNASWVNPNAISWSLTGNAGTTAGTNFIGTTDTQDLDFRTNNQLKLRLTQQGQLSFLNSGASVFIGGLAGDVDDLTNNQNTFVGTASGQLNTTGSLNTAIGHAALNINVSGAGNTAIGKSTLITNDLGSNNTALGRLADVSTGSLTNATAIGFGATVNASNKVRIGSAAVTVIEGQVAYTFPSDARFKFNVKENVPGLDFIKKLKPVTYNFDTKKFDEHVNQNRKSETLETDYSKSTALIHTGFLAQDIEKICADLGYDFDGLHIPDASNPTDNYSVAYSQFIMPIVKAVQEQQEIIESQKTELEQLKSELEKYKMLEERIKALEQK